MSKRVDYRKDLICGFRFFVGDVVCLVKGNSILLSEESSVELADGEAGFIQWINTESQLISVRFRRGRANAYVVVPPDEIKKVDAKRDVSTLLPLVLLRQFYQQMSFNEKCFFRYNKGEGVKEIAQRANASEERVKTALRKRRGEIVYKKRAV